MAANGSERTTAQNIKSLFSRGTFLRWLRKAMGLGDTLGALPPENGGTGSTTAQGILEKAYPVGSIYMSLNSTNPQTLFGGTWAPIRDRFLVGAGGSYAAKATGGEAAHELTVDEMPRHGHDFEYHRNVNSLSTDNSDYLSGAQGRLGVMSADGAVLGTAAKSVSPTGSGTAHNNLPPYYAVYMWARTA